MQYLIEVKDNKDKFILEVLKHFSFVKTKPLTKANLQFVKELQQSVEEVNKAKKGKAKLQNAKDLVNAL
jgi:hypothetical protein